MGNTCCPIHQPPTGHISEYSEDPEPNPQVDKVKLLLLGAGESGKSTLFKQMMINYVQDYSEETLSEEKPRIIRSIYQSFRNFLAAVKTIDPNLGGDEELIRMTEVYFPNNGEFPTTIQDEPKKLMTTVWNSESGKRLWEMHERYPVTDSLSFFMEDLDRFSDVGYEPTEEDLLNARVTTAGIHEQTFVYRGVVMTVVDVGGQRAERGKWLTCLDGVTAVLFVASLSAFDQALFEDTTVMRLPEALTLFKKTFNFFPFRTSNTPFVLFLNKEDLLEEKLRRMEKNGKNLDEFFPDLGRGTNYDNIVATVKEHIKEKFLAMITEQQRGRVIPHFITATDKDTFLKIFKAAAQVVLRKALEEHFRQAQEGDI